MIEEQETWLPLMHYEHYYHVSNLGNILSLRSELLMKQNRGKDGYLRVRLSVGGIAYTYLVHRLIAETFLANPDNLPEINHKNGIKHDPRLNNLEWSTRIENAIHARDILNRTSFPMRIIIGSKHNEKITFFCLAEAGRKGFSRRHIASCLAGKRKRHKGYVWSEQKAA